MTRAFGGQRAVDGVSLAIPRGSFFSILGPSGCGKTTLLRMIAGFDAPDSGDILIKGISVIGVPPNRRPVNMVFQHLALFPTMTVAGNIGYGLRRRGLPRAEIARKVAEALERIELPGMGDRMPAQLSGGQRQRVAIARCMVLEPAVLLLDEPLGALDLKLRERMKVELKQIQARFDTTFVYITHDQSEALVMSDTVAVMNRGRFEQVGSPQDLYHRPATAFVAGFVGDANRWTGRIEAGGGGLVTVRMPGGLALRAAGAGDPGGLAELFVRPEAMVLLRAGEAAGEGMDALDGRVESLLFNGAASRVLVRAGAETLEVALPQTGAFAGLAEGDAVRVAWSPDQVRLFAAGG